MSALQELGEARYVNLETYRKNGTGVKTPVWVAPAQGELVVFTNGDSYKVKRLRRNAAMKVATCDMRGGLKGPWHDAEGRIIEDQGHKDAALKALKKKYGWQMTLANWGAAIRGTKKNWAVLAIRLGE